MTKQIKLFLDLDGVFSDFIGGAREMLGLEYPKEKIPDEEFKKFREYLGYKIWCKKHFWTDLNELPGCQEMYSVFKNYNPTILTAVPHAYHVISAEAITAGNEKRLWVLDHFGKEQTKRFIWTKAELKQEYVVDDPSAISILVDDHKTNIDQWNSRGGVGIWHTSVEGTLEQFEKIIELSSKEYF